MDTKMLQEIGFTEKEAKIYLKLLMLGPSSASIIAKEVGFDRTSTYYILLRMLDKGEVSQYIESNVKTFAATNPEQLLKKIDEKRDILKEIIPKLNKIKQTEKDKLTVEIRQGKEGFKHLYRDAIANSKLVLGFGIDDSQYADFDKLSLDVYYREAEKAGLKEKFITYDGAFTFGSHISEYRTIPKKYFQPTPVFVYGDRIVMISWIPVINLIFITSKELADSYRKHFELMWKVAKPYK